MAACALSTGESIRLGDGVGWVGGGENPARRFYERNGWIDSGLIEYPAATGAGPVVIRAHRYDKRVTSRAAGPRR